MTSNGIGRFVGGSPVVVALRLIVVSLIVGIIFEAFGFDPASLFGDVTRAARRLVEFGFADLHRLGRILLTGAMVVIPVWLVLRLLDSGSRR